MIVSKKLENKLQVIHMLLKEFEHILASILNHNLTSSLNSILLDLLAEETRMISLSSLSSPSNSFAAYKGKYHGLSTIECFNYHEKGPYASYYCNQRDSGATHYMTGDLTIFTFSKSSLVPDTITVANGMNLDIQRSVTLKFIFSDSPSLVLSDFLYVPKLSANLISVNQLLDKHFFIFFSPNSCLIQDLRTGKHRRLGHPRTQNLKSLFSSGDLVSKIDFKNNVTIDCEYCTLTKSHFLPFNKESTDAVVPSTPLSSYFDDEPDRNVIVFLVAPPPLPTPDLGIPSSSHVLSPFETLHSVVIPDLVKLVNLPPACLFYLRLIISLFLDLINRRLTVKNGTLLCKLNLMH
ncbi:hypothetical protein CQW23_18978 [Capsicum baccatum]|uniref:Retrovirus-related Pol polyprotein from transposon TNT 1-94-like beta-barrel domain-containing protein n=1 Tax=Capsicum baccatum TaxID=33114 RepID=A0A2G2W4H8_CAPBA|nr:hypothetical protein CQW23_18978 [Capsicum baccatum]